MIHRSARRHPRSGVSFCRGSAEVAQLVHTQQVAGSIPAPATNNMMAGDMARLKSLPSRLAVAPLRMGRASVAGDEATRSRRRDAEAPWRAWYKTARWQRLRWSVLARDLFTCCRCGRIEGQTSQLVADHKTPHRGDEAMFWAEDNLQCLCKTCHDRDKQREERRVW